MAPVKKSKSTKTSESINSRLQLVVKSGKVGQMKEVESEELMNDSTPLVTSRP